MDTKAINANEIGNMQSAIESYTTDVESKLKKIKDFKVDTDKGVYGNKQIDTVNSYLDETCKQIGSIVRQFDDFKAVLDKIGGAYDTHQAKVSLGTVAQAKERNEDEFVHVQPMD